MRDDELLNVMKQTLSDTRMDRPVEAIEQRGRALRRQRRLLAATAGGGLAAVAALALALPMASHQPGTPPDGTGPVAGASTTGDAPAMEQVAFTIVKQANGSVELTLTAKVLLDPEALQKALTDAGIPAVVKAGVHCTPKGKQLPQYNEVFPPVTSERPASVYPNGLIIAIAPAKMPKNSVVYFSVYPASKGIPSKGYPVVDEYLVSKDAPMDCRSV